MLVFGMVHVGLELKNSNDILVLDAAIGCLGGLRLHASVSKDQGATCASLTSPMTLGSSGWFWDIFSANVSRWTSLASEAVMGLWHSQEYSVSLLDTGRHTFKLAVIIGDDPCLYWSFWHGSWSDCFLNLTENENARDLHIPQMRWLFSHVFSLLNFSQLVSSRLAACATRDPVDCVGRPRRYKLRDQQLDVWDLATKNNTKTLICWQKEAAFFFGKGLPFYCFSVRQSHKNGVLSKIWRVNWSVLDCSSNFQVLGRWDGWSACVRLPQPFRGYKLIHVNFIVF